MKKNNNIYYQISWKKIYQFGTTAIYITDNIIVVILADIS